MDKKGPSPSTFGGHSRGRGGRDEKVLQIVISGKTSYAMKKRGRQCIGKSINASSSK